MCPTYIFDEATGTRVLVTDRVALMKALTAAEPGTAVDLLPFTKPTPDAGPVPQPEAAAAVPAEAPVAVAWAPGAPIAETVVTAASAEPETQSASKGSRK